MLWLTGILILLFTLIYKFFNNSLKKLRKYLLSKSKMINLYVPKLIRRVLFDQVMVSVHEGTTFLPHFFFLDFTWFRFFFISFLLRKNKCKIDLIVKLSSVQWKLRKILVFFTWFSFSAIAHYCSVAATRNT